MRQHFRQLEMLERDRQGTRRDCYYGSERCFSLWMCTFHWIGLHQNYLHWRGKHGSVS
jgi:hypothetical protein